MEKTYKTGYFARAKGGELSARGTKVHIVDGATHKPLCGFTPDKTMSFQWNSNNINLEYLECTSCRHQVFKIDREGEIISKRRPFRTYDVKDIQKVYRRHSFHCGTVIYSEDGGYTWNSVGMDSGKWHINDWLFAFIEI